MDNTSFGNQPLLALLVSSVYVMYVASGFRARGAPPSSNSSPQFWLVAKAHSSGTVLTYFEAFIPVAVHVPRAHTNAEHFELPLGHTKRASTFDSIVINVGYAEVCYDLYFNPTHNPTHSH